MRVAAIAIGIAAVTPASPVSAVGSVGHSEFRYVSDLANAGFEPFGVTDKLGALFGMKKNSEMYLCFSVDAKRDSDRRWNILEQEVGGRARNRQLPNIPIACIKTQ